MALVKNSEDRFVNLAGIVTLSPGVNDVPDAVWKRALEHKAVKRKVEGPGATLEVIRKLAEGETVTNAGTPGGETDLSKLDPADAIAIVGETYDVATLSRWAKDARDGNVKGAIEQQLKAAGLSEEERAELIKRKKGHR